VRNVEDDLYFATIQEAIDAGTTEDDETIELTADIETLSQITINKGVILEGNGFTISPNFGVADDPNSNNSVIGITSTDGVEVKNVIINGVDGVDLHGVNVFNSTDILLTSLTVNDNDNSAVNIAGSEVIIDSIETAGNGAATEFHVISAAKGTDTNQESSLVIRGTSIHEEDPEDPINPKLHVVVSTESSPNLTDEENQYDDVTSEVNALLASLQLPTFPENTRAYILSSEPELATVTMCKVDQDGQELSDWTLMLQGNLMGDYEVPANSNVGVDTAPVVAGVSHIVLADGTWDNNRGPLNIVDAEYSTEDNWVTTMDGFTGFGPDILELFVAGTNGDWGPYNDSHQYVQTHVPATDGPINLTINDTNYADNTGSLDVRVYEGFAGVTEANGCVEFTDVPYGDYEIAEMMQTGWTNLSGLGSVTVDEDNETFMVTNLDPNAPTITINATKIVCDYEDELPKWGKRNNGNPGEISSTTATVWLSENSDTSCRIVDWDFQWSDDSVTSPGGYNSYLGEAPGWNTFNGTTEVVHALLNGGNIEFREVLTDDYIPFSGGNDSRPSAELYCGNDVLNYDNLERVRRPQVDDVINCVAWNAPKEVPPAQCTMYSDTETVVQETNEYAAETFVHDSWTNDIDGATWVWSSQFVQDPTNDETFTFVETFTVTDLTDLNSSTIDVAADNKLTVKVNNNVVLDRTNQNNFIMPHTDIDISSFVVAGENVVEFIVKNDAGSDRPKRNPAGVLYRIDIESEGRDSCAVTTEPEEPVLPATLAITSPASPGLTLPSDIYDFTAEYVDDDETVDTINWAIYAGSCNHDGSNRMAGNASDDPSTFSGADFSAEVDMSKWANGQYCFVVNPSEQPEEDDLRATQTFFLESYTISGVKWEDVNGNGEIDESEQTLNNWRIVLSDGENETEILTSDGGQYSFEVSAGTWIVTEVLETGWTQTGQYYNGEPVSTDDPNFGSCTFVIPVQDSPNQQFTCSFGNQENVSIITTNDTPDSTGGENNGNDGNGSSGGDATRVEIERVPRPEPLVLGATVTNQCPLLFDHMQISQPNDPMEVMKLQLFLDIFKDTFGGSENPVTGVFGTVTDENVKAFQAHYSDEILAPWYDRGIVPHMEPTGFVYKTTLWKINSIVCPDNAVLPNFENEDLNSNVDID
jgi:hypothetical protein